MVPGKKAQEMESCQCDRHYELVQGNCTIRNEGAHLSANPRVFQHPMIIVKVEDIDFINRVTGNNGGKKRMKEKRGA